MPDEKPDKSSKSRTSDEVVIIDPQLVVAAVNGLGSGLRLSPGSVVFRQGAPADAVFYVRDGRVQLTVVSDHGKEGVIALFGPGEFFGEGCLAGQPVRLASAVTTVA